jgi:hypothetical protein
MPVGGWLKPAGYLSAIASSGKIGRNMHDIALSVSLVERRAQPRSNAPAAALECTPSLARTR